MPASSRSRSAPTRARFGGHLAARPARRDAQPGDRRHVLGAGAAVALVLAAGQDRLHPRAALDPQRAGALRAVELVRRQRQQIDAERAHVDRNLAGRLHGVGVHQRAVLVRDRGELGDRLNRADLVVRVHHRDERRVVGRSPRAADRARRRRSDRPAAASCASRGAPAPCSVLSTASCSMRAGDQVTAAGRLERLGGAADREVVGLGAAAGEHDLRRVGADQRRDRRSRVVERRLGLLAEVMHARRVAEHVARRGGRPRRRPRARAGSSRCSQSRHACVNRSL